jgi:hypothetical protein
MDGIINEFTDNARGKDLNVTFKQETRNEKLKTVHFDFIKEDDISYELHSESGIIEIPKEYIGAICSDVNHAVANISFFYNNGDKIIVEAAE